MEVEVVRKRLLLSRIPVRKVSKHYSSGVLVCLKSVIDENKLIRALSGLKVERVGLCVYIVN